MVACVRSGIGDFLIMIFVATICRIEDWGVWCEDRGNDDMTRTRVTRIWTINCQVQLRLGY